MVSVFILVLCTALSVSAAAVNKRADVTCQTVHTSTLVLSSTNSSATYNVSSVIPAELMEAILVTETEGLSPLNAKFQQCDSSFMGFSENSSGTATTFYGHVLITGYPAGWPPQCLISGESSITGGGSFLITIDECATADNSTQLSQYWSLTTGTNVNNIAFLGVTANGTTIYGDDTTYTYMMDDVGSDSPAIEVLGHPGYEPSDYVLRFAD